MRMFQHEWELQKRQGVPRRIAIVDDRPAEQYLYPEFLLAQRFFQKNGIDAVIVDGSQLRYERGQLLAEGKPDRSRLQSTGRFFTGRSRTQGSARGLSRRRGRRYTQSACACAVRRQAQSGAAVRSRGASLLGGVAADAR